MQVIDSHMHIRDENCEAIAKVADMAGAEKFNVLSLAMKVARRCLAVVRQNIVFALAVKFGCLALGAFGLVGMQAAIFADVGVMVLAVLNSMRTLGAAKN